MPHNNFSKPVRIFFLTFGLIATQVYAKESAQLTPGTDVGGTPKNECLDKHPWEGDSTYCARCCTKKLNRNGHLDPDLEQICLRCLIPKDNKK